MLIIREASSLRDEVRLICGGDGFCPRRPSGDALARGYSRMKVWISSEVALPSLLASTLSKIRL